MALVREHWAGRQEWIDQARVSVEQLWRRYKSDKIPGDRPDPPQPASERVDEWADDDESLRSSVDQLAQYYAEPPHDKSLPVNKSPVSYWIEEKTVWPQLAAIALDVFSVPAMSDEPKRIFSQTEHILSPRRGRLTSKSMQRLMCMKSWLNQGVAHLGSELCEKTASIMESQDVAADSDDLSDQSDGNHGGV